MDKDFKYVEISKEDEERFMKEVEKIEAAENIIRENIKSSDDYIEWLISFLNKLPNKFFFDDYWEYNSKDMEEKDLENIKKLEVFVGLCIEKASNNITQFYYSSDYSNGEIYVEFKDKFIMVGSISGQGTQYYAEFIDNIGDVEFVKWEDVKTDFTNETSRERQEILAKLETLIKDAINKGVNLEYIQNMLRDIE